MTGTFLTTPNEIQNVYKIYHVGKNLLLYVRVNLHLLDGTKYIFSSFSSNLFQNTKTQTRKLTKSKAGKKKSVQTEVFKFGLFKLN